MDNQKIKKLIEDYENGRPKAEATLTNYLKSNNVWEVRKDGIVYFIYKDKLEKYG